MPVDLYVGGAEHAVLHLLYSRFWHKVLYDAGLVSTPEPFHRVVNQGMILGKTYLYYLDEAGGVVSFRDRKNYEHLKGDVHPDYFQLVPTDEVRWVENKPLHPTLDIELEEIAEKMSKSRHNVITPDAVIEEYGADALRLYEMFMGPLEQSKPWDQRSVNGVFRFLTRIWRLLISEDDAGQETLATKLSADATPSDTQLKELHRMLKRVTEDTEELRFNTAIAAMMEYVNFLYKQDNLPYAMILPLLITLSPYAPHMAEELWHRFGQQGSVVKAVWPAYDEALLRESSAPLAVQVMGKLRGTIMLAATASQEDAVAAARADESLARHLEDTPRRVIYVPGKILNFVF